MSKMLLSHIMDFFPRHEFNQCVARYKGNYRTRSFSCYDQWLSMFFAQITGRESLRDIENCLQCFSGRLYHAGFRGRITKSTLADANEQRDWRIYQDLAYVLMKEAKQLYRQDSLDFPIDEAVYALDSTNIEMCLSLFPWAKFQKTKGGLRLHTMLDLRGSIPNMIIITDAKAYDTLLMDNILWQAGSYYVMDRGYIDFSRLYKITEHGAFFVIRMRKKLSWKRYRSRPCSKQDGLICDQLITLGYSKSAYPQVLRRVKYREEGHKEYLEIMTNQMMLKDTVIVQLYKARWNIETFFKWIKQHLKITTFYGTSQNAVKTQIWIAVCTYLLVSIIKKKLNLTHSTYHLVQMFGLTLFEKIPNIQSLTIPEEKYSKPQTNNQLLLFDL